MKKLILLLLFIPLVSFGQKSNDADALKLCVALQSNNFTTDAEAEDAVNKILSVIGASQKPILQACSNINNAVAAVYKGQRYILYDRDFMNSLTAGSNQYWSNMFILAHEVGHHINGHSLDIILYANDVIDPKSLSEKRAQELEADEFAGFVLAKLGASLSQTSKVLSNLPRISNENSSTHPSKEKRIASVRIGYKRGEVKKAINQKTESYASEIINSNWKSKYLSSKNTFWEPFSKADKRTPRNVILSDWIEYEKKENGGSIDPFTLENLKELWPIKVKKTSALAYNNNKTKKYTLEIKQSLYTYKQGGASQLIPIEQKYHPNTNYEINIIGFKEMPAIQLDTYSDAVPRENRILLDSTKFRIIQRAQFENSIPVVKFEYIIDNNVKDYFLAQLDGWDLPVNKPTPRKITLWPPPDFYYGDYITDEIQEEWLNKLLKFIEGIKNGNKLYLKIDNEITFKSQNIYDLRSWWWNEFFESIGHTYIIDLTGSSKALQF